MPRYKCVIAYDGTGFAGYQVQPGKRTVQSEIEAALAKMHKGTKIPITASGRTDAGVHAVGQVIHFDSTHDIPLENWHRALNSLVPSDIVVKRVEMVDDAFHARYNPIGKEYRYVIDRSKERNPFQRNYRHHYPYSLDVAAMRSALLCLMGTHDFSSFCAANTSVVDKVRTIQHIELIEEQDSLTFRFVGTGFLYNMVRILVGTLLEVGAGKIKPTQVEEILAKRDRSLAGKTAPSQGLYLWEVFY